MPRRNEIANNNQRYFVRHKNEKTGYHVYTYDFLTKLIDRGDITEDHRVTMAVSNFTALDKFPG